MKPWMADVAAFGCALLVLSIAPGAARAQDRSAQFSRQEATAPAIEGPAIQMLLRKQLPDRDLRKLVTDSQTARRNPDLAEYYRNRAQRFEAESERYEEFARAAGDTLPLSAPGHYGVSRSARFDYLVAQDKLRKSQNDRILAALHGQAARQVGCFACHSFNGQGGKAGPDLAREGTRGRSDGWLIAHFKNPQAAFPGSVMPALGGLTNRELKTLTAFLQFQKVR